MKKVIVLFLVSLSTMLASGFSCAEVIDKIAIVVNDEIVTQGEIDRMLYPIYQQYSRAYQGEELTKRMSEATQIVVQQLIDDKIILSEAKKLNVETSAKEVEDRIDDLKRRLGSKKELEKALLDQRITLKDLRTRYREQLMMRKLIDQKIGSKVTVTPVEINEYYRNHINEFTQPEEVKFWNILISPKNDPNPQRALALAREISSRLKEGGEFAALAKIYSQGPNASEGGLTGFVKRGELLPEIEKVVFNMKVGEISGVVQTSVGYHLFKLEDRHEKRMLPLSEVRRDVEELVFREKSRERIKDWVENLKKNAYIAFK